MRVVFNALKKFSSADLQRDSKFSKSGGTKRAFALRRVNASIRLFSVAVAKPHHALDAYCSLATTTERKTVCTDGSSIRGCAGLSERRVFVRTCVLLW